MIVSDLAGSVASSQDTEGTVPVVDPGKSTEDSVLISAVAGTVVGSFDWEKSAPDEVKAQQHCSYLVIFVDHCPWWWVTQNGPRCMADSQYSPDLDHEQLEEVTQQTENSRMTIEAGELFRATSRQDSLFAVDLKKDHSSWLDRIQNAWLG